jgi:hypothetical protein
MGMLALVLTFGLVLTGCVSAPPAPPQKMQAGSAVLSGKTALVLSLTLAERVKAQDTTSSDDSIMRGLVVSSGIDEYVKQVDTVAARNSDDISAKIEEASSSFIEAYNAAFNTTLINATFDFGKDTPAINFFAKPSAEVVAQITQLCSDNNAEYVVALLYQFVDGPVVEAMTTADTTSLTAYAFVLDKTGKVVSINYGGTAPVEFRFVYMKSQVSKEEMFAAHDDLILQLFDAFKDGLPGLVKGL